MSKFTDILSKTRKQKNMTKADVAKKWGGLPCIMVAMKMVILFLVNPISRNSQISWVSPFLI